MNLVIDAPRLGQRLTFWADEGDDTLRALTVLQPGAFTPLHVHLRQHERFETRSGELEVRIGRDRRVFGPGDEATIEPGAAHCFRNRGGVPVEAEVAMWPALRTRELFETLFALDRAGRLNRMGAPGLLRLGLLAREYGDELFLLGRVSPALQLSVARLFGSVAAGMSVQLMPQP